MPIAAGSSRWREVAAVVVVTLFALALRTLELDTAALWFDEGLTLVVSQWPLAAQWTEAVDPTPPLYYTLHHLFVPPDADVVLVRAPAMVAGVLAVPVMYALARTFLGVGGASLAATLLAVNAVHVHFSQEARAYSLLFLAVLLSAWGLARLARDRLEAPATGLPWAAYGLYGGGTVLAFYSHFTSVFWIALSLAVVAVLMARDPRPDRRRVLIWTLGVTALAALPGLRLLAVNLIGGTEFVWYDQRSLLDSWRVIVGIHVWRAFLDGQGHGSPMEMVLTAALNLPLALAVLAGAWRWRRRPAAWLVVAAFLAAPVGM